MNRAYRYLPLLFSISFAYAQSAVDVNVGLGTAHNKAPGTGLDANGATCITGSTCELTPGLGGVFMGFGGTIMLTNRYGFSGQASLQPKKQDYAGGLQFRQIFYHVNGVYAPVNQKKVMLRLEGGLGGATTSFSFTQSSCVGTAICQTQSQSYGSAKHFLLHAGAGVQIYVNDHVFIRPQFDLHYIPNFKNQFGSSVAPAAMVFIGYSLGDR